MIAEIIPEKRTGAAKNTFSYLVPQELRSQVKIGSICNVPFGKKTIRGVVSKLSDVGNQLSADYELKEVKSVDAVFNIPQKYIDIAEWISVYYLCSLGEAIGLFLPPKISRPRKSVIDNQPPPASKSTQLTAEQETVFSKLKEKLIYCSKSEMMRTHGSRPSPSNNKPALLFGVTGSGKTEIYIKLADEALKLNKQVVVLTPEIVLTPQLVERFEKAFPNQICTMHSGLSKSERYVSYRQFAEEKKQIIIGPRSALLVPSENIGLVIVDEEQEDAYKQEKKPRYHAVDLAEQIAKRLGALLLMGSATPRIETYFRAQKGDFDLFEIKSRYGKLFLPPAEVVDLKNEIKRDNYSPISLTLQKEIASVLKNKRHIILFLNRRGAATFVSCRECGEVINCPRCEIPLVYHINYEKHRLSCHHCDYIASAPAFCPSCGSPKIKFFGAGVDKIEREIVKLFPGKTIKKIDSSVLQNKGSYLKLYQSLKEGKIDILIGTQILAKGLDIGTVDLVGIISADVGLHLPQFRATEKTFTILTQVSGRSGRKENVGKTIIQTYWPESSAINFSATHSYKDFYAQEILERKKYNYPPYCRLTRIIVENKNDAIARKEIEEICGKLKNEGLNYIGPARCFLSKINYKFRYHILIKTRSLPNSALGKIYKEHPYSTWDSDPIDLL